MTRSLFAQLVSASLAVLATLLIVGGVGRVADHQHASAVLAQASAQPTWLAEVSCSTGQASL